MQMEEIMLSEVSQTWKMYTFPHRGKLDPKINIYTKQAWSYTNSNVKHICNCGTTLWSSEIQGKEKWMIASVILHTIRCKGRGYKDLY
jgi:hypothetical protein